MCRTRQSDTLNERPESVHLAGIPRESVRFLEQARQPTVGENQLTFPMHVFRVGLVSPLSSHYCYLHIDTAEKYRGNAVVSEVFRSGNTT